MTQTKRELEIEAYSQRLYALEAQQKPKMWAMPSKCC